MTKKKNPNDSSFTRLLGWTVVLSLVFSAGMITGQRLLRHDSMPPLVSLSSEAQAAQDKQATATPAPLKTTFSFYEHLAKVPEGADVDEQPPGERPTVGDGKDESVSQRTVEPGEEVQAAENEQVVAEASASTTEGIEKADSTESSESPVQKAESPESPAQDTEPEKAVASESVEEAGRVDDPAPSSLVARVAAAFESEPKSDLDTGDEVATYTIQVGNHSSKAAAVRELSRLRAMKIDAHMITVEVGERRLYRVRVGKFTTDESARADLEELSAREITGMIVPL